MHALPTSTLADDFRPGCITIRGESMWPSLRTGDEATLSAAEPLRPGDVVVGRFGRRFIAHRVQQVGGGQVVLRGDACLSPDPALPVERLLGRVEQVRRGGRLLQRAEWDVGPSWLGRLQGAVARVVARAARAAGSAR